MILREQDGLLKRVQKPGRYIGGEINSVKKDLSRMDVHFGFAFPDAYEIGMSYLGLEILYALINGLKYACCERIFAPGSDMEIIMRTDGIPLFTIESGTPARELDFLGFTLQYELSYTNVINMLDLSGIPIRREERGEGVPFVIGGGPCAYNPEPLADFFDFFVLGDAEEVLPAILERYRAWKSRKEDRQDFLLDVADIKGVYVPGFYRHIYYEDGTIKDIVKLNPKAPDSVTKNCIKDLNAAVYPLKPIVPLIEVVHDRAVVEIFRGCTRGCRFCQAGMIYRPVRERTKEKISELSKQQILNTGYDELSLLSLSSNDHSKIEPLVTELMKIHKDDNVALSLPSLRLDASSFRILKEIQAYKKTGLTFAPEAGTQRLRNVINKTITDDDIYDSIKRAMILGWNSVKLYFMIGLPTEEDEDLEGIARLASNIMLLSKKACIQRGRFQLTISISNFVPKAHTPFQWVSQDSVESLEQKHEKLKKMCLKIPGVRLNYHNAEQSKIEAALARGDRRLGQVIVKAWEKGCKFDAWREHFNYSLWMAAFRETSVDSDFYTYRQIDPKSILPWDILSCGVSKRYLLSEWKKGLKEETTRDCRQGCTACGMMDFCGKDV